MPGPETLDDEDCFASMPGREKISVFWFRRDLRIFDNAGLFHALQEKYPVLPVFIFDINILSKLEDRNDPRITFLHRQITLMHNKLMRYGSGVLVLHGDPVDVFRKLTKDYRISKVFTNRDYEPDAIERDKKVAAHLRSAGIGFEDFKDQVIFERNDIAKSDGTPYKVFTAYKNSWLQAFRNGTIEPYTIDLATSKLFQWDPRAMPSLRALGFGINTLPIPADKIDDNKIAQYDQVRDYPALEGTSRLGIHLRHGTLSTRQVVLNASQLNDTWLNELIWREFYMMILWNFPHVAKRAFKPAYDHIPWINNQEQFQKWCAGMTGYPIVDAGMRELNATGFMHNRARMVTASFLTKHLLIDWRWGEHYFASKLLDFELSSNNGGWQWSAGTGTDAQPYFRIFNPWSQAEKFDPKQEYIKKWIPELGTSSYPAPMVDHKKARDRAIKTYKQAVL